MSLKILVVDDDELTIRLLGKRLESLGYIVVTAQDGQEALKKTTLETPDIILMDIMLPDMQGSDVVKRLQDTVDLKKVKIIFLSAIIASESDSQATIQVGGVFYPAIGKPVDFDCLKKILG